MAPKFLESSNWCLCVCSGADWWLSLPCKHHVGAGDWNREWGTESEGLSSTYSHWSSEEQGRAERQVGHRQTMTQACVCQETSTQLKNAWAQQAMWYPEKHYSVVPHLHALPHLTLYIPPPGWVSASSRTNQKFTSLTFASLAGIRTEPSKRLTGTPTDSLSSRGSGRRQCEIWNWHLKWGGETILWNSLSLWNAMLPQVAGIRNELNEKAVPADLARRDPRACQWLRGAQLYWLSWEQEKPNSLSTQFNKLESRIIKMNRLKLRQWTCAKEQLSVSFW